MRKREHTKTICLASLLALAIEIIPLPHVMMWAKPQALLLAICFGILYARLGLWVIWILACCLDVLKGNLLGQHAFMLTLVGYAMIRWRQRFLMFSELQQALMFVMVAYAYQAYMIWIQSMLQYHQVHMGYWLAPWVTGVIWFWLAYWLRLSYVSIVSRYE